MAKRAVVSDLVEVQRLIPDAILELRYATADNFMKRAVYPSGATCLLRPATAERLRRVADSLRAEDGTRLILYDCYRPLSVQAIMWEVMPVRGYVAPPKSGSIHNRGAAVDLGLASKEGAPLPMPSDFDEFSKRAWHANEETSPERKRNRQRLREAMLAEGFQPIRMEWWHYEDAEERRASLLDLPFDAAAPPRIDASPLARASRADVGPDQLEAMEIVTERAQATRGLRAATDNADADPSFGDFGFDFLRVVGPPSENVVLSPVTLGVALSLASAGAKGETREEIRRALHAPPYAVPGVFAMQKDNACGVHGAIAVFLKSTLALTDGYSQILSDAGIERHRFFEDPELTRGEINRWGSEQTRGAISELVPPGGVLRSSQLALVSATDLKIRWATEFDPGQTRRGRFRLMSGREVEAPSMRGKQEARVAFLDDVSLLELPLACGQWTMLVLMPPDGADRMLRSGETGLGLQGLLRPSVPDSGGAAEPPTDWREALGRLERSLSSKQLAQWRASAIQSSVFVELPSFEGRQAVNASETLRKLGIRRAFEPGADFSGISETTRLFIENVFHESTVKVGERGVEATSGAAVIFGARGTGPSHPVFRVDRPFVFLIQDQRTGAVAFVGRIVDPRR